MTDLTEALAHLRKFALGLLAGGAVMFAAMYPYGKEKVRFDRPAELSDFERTAKDIAPLETKLKPMTVTVTFMDRADFNASKYGSPPMAGWTDWWSGDTCRIAIANDAGSIYSVPSYGRVLNGTVGNILEHELMHCLRGAWHPTWDKIEADEKAEIVAMKSKAVSTQLTTTSFTIIRPNDSQISISSMGDVECPKSNLTEAEAVRMPNLSGAYGGIFLAIWRGYCPVRFAPLSTFEKS